jgi:hypothetical protein
MGFSQVWKKLCALLMQVSTEANTSTDDAIRMQSQGDRVGVHGSSCGHERAGSGGQG